MGYFLAIDIGGLSVKYGILDYLGKVYEKGSMPSERENFDLFINALIKVIKGYKKKYPIMGIAISSPGAVDAERGVVEGGSALPCIHGHDFRKILKAAVNLPVEIENDANCAALGEVWKGAARFNQDVAFVVCGTGIGGAIVKDKKIHKGANNHGGEFGYTIAYISETEEGIEFVNWSEVASPGNMARYACKLKDLPLDKLSAKEVFELADNGDEVAKKAIDKMYFELAKGLYNIQYTYDPEKIILGGAISAREDFIQEIECVMARILKATPLSKVTPKIEVCRYQGDANLIGALYHYLQKNNLLEGGRNDGYKISRRLSMGSGFVCNSK